jgi:uncharacterized protein YggE
LARDNRHGSVEAFESAKAKAARLAKATQVKLGKVKTLSSREFGVNDYSDYYECGRPSPAP